jgi:hypothetical protein
MTSWSRVYAISLHELANGISTFVEHNESVVLINGMGVFKVERDGAIFVYRKCNSWCPDNKITAIGTENTGYGRNIVYSMSRLSGSGVKRDRNSSGVTILQESGPVKWSGSAKDYTGCWDAEEWGASTSPTAQCLSGFKVPTDPVTGSPERHWTHYTRYDSLTIGTNGTDPVTGAVNNPESFLWHSDVPVCKAFYGAIAEECSEYYFNLYSDDSGEFSDDDIGCDLVWYDGDTVGSYTIEAVISPTKARVTGPSGEQNVLLGAIGIDSASDVMSLSQTGNSVTIDFGTHSMSSADVGKIIHWCDGSYSVISAFDGCNTWTVLDSNTRVGPPACMNPTARQINTTKTDASLRATGLGWTLTKRLFEEIPTGNTGVIIPGYLFVAQANGDMIYYSEASENLAPYFGYYHPAYQYLKMEDLIRNLSVFPDRIIVYRYGSTSDIVTNTFTYQTDEAGNEVAIVAGQNTIDHNLGLSDFNSFVKIENGLDLCINQDMGWRIFNGMKYSDNMAADKIMAAMNGINKSVSLTYDPINGVTLWGKD